MTCLSNKEFVEKMLGQYENHPDNVASFMNCLANLCYGGASKTKQCMIDHIKLFLPKFIDIINYKKKSSTYLNLKSNLYNLLSNLMTDKEVRATLGSHHFLTDALVNRIQKIDFGKDERWVANVESLMGTFVNLLHESIPENL